MSTIQDHWRAGYAAGYAAGNADSISRNPASSMDRNDPMFAAPKKRKRKQTGKAKILTDMTRPIWNKYKKGSGKKTYFDIRSQVQRSQKYRKKTKGM